MEELLRTLEDKVKALDEAYRTLLWGDKWDKGVMDCLDHPFSPKDFATELENVKYFRDEVIDHFDYVKKETSNLFPSGGISD